MYDRQRCSCYRQLAKNLRRIFDELGPIKWPQIARNHDRRSRRNLVSTPKRQPAGAGRHCASVGQNHKGQLLISRL